VNAALNGYFYDLYDQTTAQLLVKVQTKLDELLVVPPGDIVKSCVLETGASLLK
jgi:hypothetical protein